MTIHRKFLAIAIAILLLQIIVSTADAQNAGSDESPERSKATAGLSKEVARAIAVGEISVKLSPVSPDRTRRLSWSPKGAAVTLLEADDAWYGKIQLASKSVAVKFNKPREIGRDATLAIDANSNGKFEPNESSTIKASLSRGKYWYSSATNIKLPFTIGQKRDYPISLWYIEDPEESGTRPVLRWSRRGWHEGQFKFLGATCTALVSDRAMDGVFNARDSWGLGKTAAEARSTQQSTAAIGKHNWLNGVAFQVVSIDRNGATMTIRAFDLGMTEAQDRKRQDPYASDREYARAKKPVQFTSDLDAALAAAKRDNKQVLVDFVTTWCGPCRVMDQLVYTAQPVVELQDATLFVKLDGDEEKELRKKYAVRAYPTLILLAPDGQVRKTAVGYQSVAKLLKMLK